MAGGFVFRPLSTIFIEIVDGLETGFRCSLGAFLGFILDLTCSIGLTTLQKGDTPPVVFDRVDKGLYEAKSSGRNCIMAN